MESKEIKNRMVVDNSDDESTSDICENTEKMGGIGDPHSEFIKQSELLLEKITKNYKEQRDDIRNLVKLHKKEIRSIKKNKRTRKTKDKTGFTKPSVVPDKLTEFLGINKGMELSRTELTALLCKEFNQRNLYHKKDRRIIVPDNDVKKLFNLPKDSDKSNNPKDKNGLNFYNLQTYIARCYNEFNANDIKTSEIMHHPKNNNLKIILGDQNNMSNANNMSNTNDMRIGLGKKKIIANKN